MIRQAVTRVLFLTLLVGCATMRTDYSAKHPEGIGTCGGGQCAYLGGNIPQGECCAKCDAATVTLGPMPGNAGVNTPVTIGATAWSFTSPDAVTRISLNCDFGNGDARHNLPFQDGVG